MKPTLNIFEGSESLGQIYTENNQINIKFLDLNMPLTGTTGRMSFNLLGKSRLITLQGAMDGSGFSGANYENQIKTFIDKIESWVNANVQTSKTFMDSFGQYYLVDAVDWTWTRSNNDPFRIIYSLILMEC